MILGLDVSTSITGATVVDSDGKIVYNEAWDLRKYKDFFQKAEVVKGKIWELEDTFLIKEIYIEQSLQSFRSGFSSAKTLSTLSRFNGVVSWLCYDILKTAPEYIAATSARKKVGITVPKGTKAKECVIKHVIDNVPDVAITYTKFDNVKPECYDKADSWVIAMAGHIQCKTKN
ncbi:MAG TPA: hypothetical protein DCM40_45970 [Maribacter sp.]|nr:hypothetical protein [Maribacter sp.]